MKPHQAELQAQSVSLVNIILFIETLRRDVDCILHFKKSFIFRAFKDSTTVIICLVFPRSHRAGHVEPDGMVQFIYLFSAYSLNASLFQALLSVRLVGRVGMDWIDAFTVEYVT